MAKSTDDAVALGVVLGLAGAVGAGLYIVHRIQSASKVGGSVRRHLRVRRFSEICCVHRVFPDRFKADLQLALDAALQRLGSVPPPRGIGSDGVGEYLDQHNFTSLDYEEVDIGEEKPVQCLQSGLWLMHAGDVPIAIFKSPVNDFMADERCQVAGVRIELAVAFGADLPQISARLFDDIEEGLKRSRSYRGKVLSLETHPRFSGKVARVRVHRLDPVKREDLILPDKTLEILERNVVNFCAQRPELKARGLDLKKGLLLHGPPGTGKTLTVQYLAHALKGHTILLLTAEQQEMLKEYIAIARLLQPAAIVIEDVDLIARSRDDQFSTMTQSLLNRLLNEMDGLQPDAEILFLLTTNRPEALEAALSSRPGRVDQAIEFPLPDSACRVRLFKLYAAGFKLGEEVIRELVARCEGASPAFIKEWCRRSAQFSLERKSAVVEKCDFEAAVEEMVCRGGALNLRLLGSERIGLNR